MAQPEGPQRKSEEERKAFWEKNGCPLFGRTWTYEELQNLERPARSAKKVKDIKTPANWPADTVVDTTSAWVFWLPEGWMQGIRTSAAGKTLKCYMTPEGKRYWHKTAVQKVVDYPLPEREPVGKVEDEDGETVKSKKYVTDEDAIPTWPEDEPEWLPRDFRLAFRQLPSGLHKVYIPPGQDEGFLFHRSCVLEWTAGTKRTVTPFAGSRFMSAIINEAAEKGTSRVGADGRPTKRNKKRPAVRAAAPEDYASCPGFGVATLAPGDDASTVPAELQQRFKEVRQRLLARGFAEDLAFLGVFRRGAEALPRVFGNLEGVYYQLAEPFGGRPCFQRVLPLASGAGICCSGHYIFWNEGRRQWQIGNLDGAKAGLAVCGEDCPGPAAARGPWRLLKDSFFDLAGEAAEA